MMSQTILGRPVSDQVWESIRAEFTMPSLEQVRRRLAELMEDTDPVMRQVVRVFVREETYCPGGHIHPTVASLFRHALELRIAHNYFTVWMITPCHDLGGARPVDSLPRVPQLHRALEGFAAQPPATRRGH